MILPQAVGNHNDGIPVMTNDSRQLVEWLLKEFKFYLGTSSVDEELSIILNPLMWGNGFDVLVHLKLFCTSDKKRLQDQLIEYIYDFAKPLEGFNASTVLKVTEEEDTMQNELTNNNEQETINMASKRRRVCLRNALGMEGVDIIAKRQRITSSYGYSDPMANMKNKI